MTADTARTDIEELWRKGYRPTVDDIVRLNAIALRIPDRDGGYSTNGLYAAPRIAYVAGVAIFEPTVQAEEWLDLAFQWPEAKSPEVRDILMAYAYAHGMEEYGYFSGLLRLRHVAIPRVHLWAHRNLSRATSRQIGDAIRYVVYGSEPGADEYPAPGPDRHDRQTPNSYQSRCAGLAREAMSLSACVSPESIARMTVNGLEVVVRQAYELHGVVSTPEEMLSQGVGEYERTLLEIETRLAAEKKEAARG